MSQELYKPNALPGSTNELTELERATLRVLVQSRRDADAKALNAISYERHLDDSRESRTSYRTIAGQEAWKMAKLIVGQRRKRVIPGLVMTALVRERIDGIDTSWKSDLSKGKTVTYTTPLMFTHDPLLAETESSGHITVPLQTGWRYAVRITGSHLHGFFGVMRPEPKDYSPEITALRAQQVVMNLDTSHVEVVENHEYGLSPFRQLPPHSDLDENDSFFQDQAGYLMAAQRILRGEVENR